MVWKVPARRSRGLEASWEMGAQPWLMGILNINDDSFSRDGRLEPAWAVSRAAQLLQDGAEIIDAGAESARPNRPPISVEEEVLRLQPLLTAWPEILQQHRASYPSAPVPLLSINTWRVEVMRAVLASGVVDLLNDMSGLIDPGPALLAKEFGCGLLIMHTVGLPKQDHRHVRYEDVVGAVSDFFQGRLELCDRVGLSREQVILDPGLGFAKTTGDDLTLLNKLEALREFQRPLLLPISRKGFIGRTLNLPDARDRDAGTMAALVAGILRGGNIFRLHDIRAAVQIRATLLAAL